MSENQSLDISLETIIRIALVGFVFYILFLSREIIIWFFFALIISLLVNPAINFLRRLRMPKILSVTLVYISAFGVLGLIIYLIAPTFISEMNQLSQNIPTYFEKVNPLLKDLGVQVTQNFDDATSALITTLQHSSSSVIKAISAFFGGLYSFLFIFTLAFFISLEEKGVERVLTLMIPKRYEDQVVNLFEKAQSKVSKWFGARILACVFVGLSSFILFFLLGMKYAFILALVSGILNFIPYIGPTLTLLFSVAFAGISDSWIVALYILIGLLVIQEIENKVLTPFLMKKFMDLPPVLVLLALLVGGTVFGFLGTVFAVPIFGIIYEFLKEFLSKKREAETY